MLRGGRDVKDSENGRELQEKAGNLSGRSVVKDFKRY